MESYVAEMEALCMEALKDKTKSTAKTYQTLCSKYSKSLYDVRDKYHNLSISPYVAYWDEWCEAHPNKNTQATTASALYAVLKNDFFKTTAKQLGDEIKENYEQQKASKPIVDAKDVKEIFQEYLVLFDKYRTINSARDALLTGLFGGCMVPRRLSDIRLLKWKKADEEDNYIEGDSFVFNTYKTSKTHGQQRIDIPDELKGPLQLLREMVGGTYVFRKIDNMNDPVQAPNFSRTIAELLGATVNQLRGAALNELHKNTPALSEMKETARCMGNTWTAGVTFYVKKGDDSAVEAWKRLSRTKREKMWKEDKKNCQSCQQPKEWSQDDCYLCEACEDKSNVTI